VTPPVGSPPPIDSQPNGRDVIDIDAGPDGGVPVTGPKEWWNRALAAFKAYIESSAVDAEGSTGRTDARASLDVRRGGEFVTDLLRRACRTQ
jgi:hypothetical protein